MGVECWKRAERLLRLFDNIPDHNLIWQSFPIWRLSSNMTIVIQYDKSHPMRQASWCWMIFLSGMTIIIMSNDLLKSYSFWKPHSWFWYLAYPQVGWTWKLWRWRVTPYVQMYKIRLVHCCKFSQSFEIKNVMKTMTFRTILARNTTWFLSPG